MNVFHQKRLVSLRYACAVAVFCLLSFLKPNLMQAEESEKSATQEHAYERLKDIVYVKRDGEDLKADLYRPESEGPHPSVLMVHGGAWRMGTKERFIWLCSALAQKGYTVMAIDYRLAPKHKFPAQIEDCEAAVEFMIEHADEYRIDTKRIGGWGYSAGGHLVSLMATSAEKKSTQPKGKEKPTKARLQAIVAGGTPTDFREMPEDNDLLAYWLGGTRGEKPELYDLASPRKFVTKDDPPMFFYHGQDDMLVPIRSSIEMVKSLKKVGVTAELFLVPDKGHMRTRGDEAAYQAGVKFLDEHLKKARLGG